MPRSILTEKVARRGFHVSREYAVDPLETIRVGEVMTTDMVTVAASLPVKEVARQYFFGAGGRRHPGYPVVDGRGRLLGVITRSSLLEHWVTALLDGAPGARVLESSPIIAYDLVDRPAITATPADSCRVAAERMARAGVKRLPVVDPDDPTRLVGLVTLGDLLKSRRRRLEEEDRRERFLGPEPARGRPRPA